MNTKVHWRDRQTMVPIMKCICRENTVTIQDCIGEVGRKMIRSETDQGEV